MNIGTHTEPTISGLRTYLKEFLSDPDVIDVHPILRWLIVNLLVVPFRPHRILHQYQSVWMKEGSPLMVNSKNFVEKISLKNPEFKFEIGMRYGKPSIKDALINLQNSKVEKVVLIPMFPQFAQATSGSCVKKAIEVMLELRINTPYEIKKPFYNEEWFTECHSKQVFDKNRPISSTSQVVQKLEYEQYLSSQPKPINFPQAEVDDTSTQVFDISSPTHLQM